MNRIFTFVFLSLSLLIGVVQGAAPAVEKVSWSAQDIAGQTVRVPAAGMPTVVLFLMVGQPRSQEALATAGAQLAKAGAFSAIAVFSGQDAAANAQQLAAEKKWAGAIVADPDYAIANRMGVHAWPTTEIISAGGEEIAHIPSLPMSYAQDLEAYLAFAAGKLDKAALQKHLEEQPVVSDSPQQIAHRHLRVAEQLMEQSRFEQARKELVLGLQHQAKDAELLLTLAHVDISLGQPDQALQEIAEVVPNTVPDWRLSQVRGRALVAKGQWDQALPILERAAKLNPEPAEAHYLLALVYQHQGDWQKAAQSFRAAFETTPAGRRAVVPGR